VVSHSAQHAAAEERRRHHRCMRELRLFGNGRRCMASAPTTSDTHMRLLEGHPWLRLHAGTVCCIVTVGGPYDQARFTLLKYVPNKRNGTCGSSAADGMAKRCWCPMARCGSAIACCQCQSVDTFARSKLTSRRSRGRAAAVS